MISFKKLQVIVLLNFIRQIQAYYPPWVDGYSETNIWQTRYFCKNNSDLVLSYKVQPSTYYVWLNEKLNTGTEITVKFDAEPSIFVNNEDIIKNNSNIIKSKDNVNNIFTFEFVNLTHKLQEIFKVEGNTPHHQIHITSLKINGIEKCLNPDLEIFNNDQNYQGLSKAHDKVCGRRKIIESFEENPLTSQSDSLGFWPWHAAIYINNNDRNHYICGGTLISTHLVLTVAHCVTVGNEKVASDMLEVVLGEHSLTENDAKQISKVNQVIVHQKYNYTILNNDIALLKLKDEIRYNNYVQPACLWFDQAYDQDNEGEIIGTIVSSYSGGEKRKNNNFSVATISIVPDVTCLLYQPVFYHILLNGLKFCAGPQNATLPCKDIGSAFMVFIEDYKPSKNVFSPNTIRGPGAWYVKGIVSATLKSYHGNLEGCDPEGYAVFTDVDKYRNWIVSYMTNGTANGVQFFSFFVFVFLFFFTIILNNNCIFF